MNCEECNFKEFDHHVDGAPRAVYTCGHPLGLLGPDGEDCPLDSKEMFDQIRVDIIGRIKAQPNSLAATADEVRICWLVGEVDRLRAKVVEAVNCLVCAAIADPLEVCQNTLRILDNSLMPPDAHEDASDRDVKAGKALKKYFCPDECPHLSPTEKEQDSKGTKESHLCRFYSYRVHHGLDHPKLHRCKKCIADLKKAMETPPGFESDEYPWDVWRYKKD